jgi:urease accessory protein
MDVEPVSLAPSFVLEFRPLHGNPFATRGDVAAAELVVEVRHKDPNQLMRLAWHLGNRHLPTEIQNQLLHIRPDHVIEDMLRGFGADLVVMQAPFQPEGGAYTSHGHHHDHDDRGHHEV